MVVVINQSHSVASLNNILFKEYTELDQISPDPLTSALVQHSVTFGVNCSMLSNWALLSAYNRRKSPIGYCDNLLPTAKWQMWDPTVFVWVSAVVKAL